MRIDETPGGAGHAARVQRGQADQSRTPRTPGRLDEGLGTDVQVSDQGRAIARAKALAGAVPDVRADRVAAIRQQIENGTYQVDSREIASRMFAQLADRD